MPDSPVCHIAMAVGHSLAVVIVAPHATKYHLVTRGAMYDVVWECVGDVCLKFNYGARGEGAPSLPSHRSIKKLLFCMLFKVHKKLISHTKAKPLARRHPHTSHVQSPPPAQMPGLAGGDFPPILLDFPQTNKRNSSIV